MRGPVAWPLLRRTPLFQERRDRPAAVEQAVKTILDAAEKGRADELGRLLDAHPDLIDARGGNSWGRTALHMAAWRNRGACARLQADKKAREKVRHPNTRPAHELAAYAGDYEHPAYGIMSIKEQDGALHWSWRGMIAAMAHRHYETFELPEYQDRLLPDRLAITFLTDREGNIVSLSAPLEPMVRDIVFARLAAGDCTDAAFRARCVGIFKSGPTTHRVTLDAEGGQLVLKPDNQPAYSLAPQHGRRFRIVELEGFAVEFRGAGAIIDELMFHQSNGTFIARRVDG